MVYQKAHRIQERQTNNRGRSLEKCHTHRRCIVSLIPHYHCNELVHDTTSMTGTKLHSRNIRQEDFSVLTAVETCKSSAVNQYEEHRRGMTATTRQHHILFLHMLTHVQHWLCRLASLPQKTRLGFSTESKTTCSG